MKKKKTEDKPKKNVKYNRKQSGNMTEIQVRRYLSDRIWKHFCKWITGQTCPVLSNGEHGFFKWDVERFADWLILGKPTYWD